MSGYKELQVYQKGYAAARSVYKITERYPKEEVYGIIGQMRRAAVSIPLNIAEGYAKKESQTEFGRFLDMAKGSANEMSVLIEISKDLGYIDKETYEKAIEAYEEIGRMLSVFSKRVKEKV